MDKRCAGFYISPIFDIVIIHLNVGAQKNIVNGPAGCPNKCLMLSGKNGIARTFFYITGTIPIILYIINNYLFSKLYYIIYIYKYF